MIATDQVIKELCRETGEPGYHNYTTIEGYMLDAIRDLSIFTMPTWSVATLNISPFNTFGWPCDCVKPLITVLKRATGKVDQNGNPIFCHFLLSVSEDLMDTLNLQLVSTDLPETQCQAEDFWRIDGFLEAYGWSIWSWGLGELYGAQTMRPPVGVVIHDKGNRQSYVKGCQIKTGDRIEFFFKSNGLTECPMFIPDEAKEQAEYFILQKWFRVRNPNLSAVNRQNYKEENYRLNSFYQQADEDTWIRAMNHNVKSSPKL